MSVIRQKFKELIKTLTPKTENVRPIITSVVITLIFFFGFYFLGNRFGEFMTIATVLLLAVMLAIIVLMAEFLVLKSLFLVAAELSLLIFLAESYCDVPNRLPLNDNAMKNLLLVGLLYISFIFCRSLYEAMRDYYKKIEDQPKEKQRGKIGGIALFLIFTGLFVYQIYLVINPIVLNLCVYK
jgi:hypothetical protein